MRVAKGKSLRGWVEWVTVRNDRGVQFRWKYFVASCLDPEWDNNKGISSLRGKEEVSGKHVGSLSSNGVSI